MTYAQALQAQLRRLVKERRVTPAQASRLYRRKMRDHQHHLALQKAAQKPPVRFVDRLQATGVGIEKKLVTQGAETLVDSFVPGAGELLAPVIAPVTGAVVDVVNAVVGGIFGGIGTSPEALTVADYVRLGKMTATPGSPVVDVGIRRGRNE